jgi:hypothetical protein
MTDEEFFAFNRDMVAEEVTRLAEAANVRPECLALGLAEVPEGADSQSVYRALYGPFLTPLDIAVGVAITRHIFRRFEALAGCENPHMELCRN